MNHPSANVVTRAVGGDEKLLVDTQVFRIRSSDRVLLCSDGLTGELTEQEILDILLDADIEEAASTLVGGGCGEAGKDNVTAVVVDFVEKKRPVL
jgi:protein phosphatase